MPASTNKTHKRTGTVETKISQPHKRPNTTSKSAAYIDRNKTKGQNYAINA